MFEEMTYDSIMQRMLDTIPNDMDKREGSIIWDALSSAALELELAYIAFDYTLMQGFVDSQEREYLIRRCAERGIIPKSATQAILKGMFTPSSVDVTGKRFSLNTLNYVVIEAIEDEPGSYTVQCESSGTQGNQNLGSLIPIEYVDGLESAALTEILILGEDEEETETLRARYVDSFGEKPFGGNRKDYLDKIGAQPGVGGVKLVRVPGGGGTVGAIIIDSSFSKASDELIATVQQAIDPPPQGEGYGLAPIGHTVTISTAIETEIDIGIVIEFASGQDWMTMQESIEAAVDNYLLDLRKEWADQKALIVRISQIETRLLSLDGVVDVGGTKINGSTANLTLESYEIPVMGDVFDGSNG